MSVYTICGTYVKTIKKNFSTNETVFDFMCKDYDDYKYRGKLRCKGIVPTITRGIPLKLTGSFKEETNGFFTFVIKEYDYYSNIKENTIKYLEDGKFKGIGRKTAEKIVEITGPDIFSFVQQENVFELLKGKIKGFSDKKIPEFINTVNKTYNEKIIYDFIRDFGGTFNQAQDISEKYGLDALKMVKYKPYEVGRNTNLPFIVCDVIASRFNGDAFNESRIRYLIISALSNLADEGNTCVTLCELYKKVTYIAINSAYPTIFINCSLIVNIIQKMNNIVKEQDENKEIVYTLKDYAIAEDISINKMKILSNAKIEFNIDIEAEIDRIEKELDINYSDRQKESFNFLKTSGIKILTGGPGTGKTTVLHGLISAFKNINPTGEIALCAPTGRAAQKIKETTGYSAFTVHKLLNINPFVKEEEEYEIEQLTTDMLIVDEASMIGTKMLAYILSAVKPSCILIFCGDIFQLPSVDAGNVLHDLIDCNKFETVILDTIHRQAENSQIIMFSSKIKDGEVSDFFKSYKKIKVKTSEGKNFTYNHDYNGKEIAVLRTKTDADIAVLIKLLFQHIFFDKTSHFFIDDLLNFQILSPTKKGCAGTVSLNEILQSLYISKEDLEESVFCKGDKVMMTENNYEKGYYNGDIGIVTSVNADSDDIIVNINGENVNIGGEDLKDVTLAYACTIHKSQGSEYDFVIIALPSEHSSMLQKNLIYTAITRAKKMVYIIHSENSLGKCITRDNSYKRKTNLVKKIKENI